MPILKDTEWRLLCVIARQTLGWQQGKTGQYKTLDWMTHRQLQARTGRASEAICTALDSLVRKGLVEVWDEHGESLMTPEVRRRSAGRLHFRLGTALQSQLSRKSETEIALSISKIEFRKAKTTKETQTKNYLPDGREPHSSGSDVQDKKVPQKGIPKQHVRNKPQSREAPNPDVHRFLRHYRAVFRTHTRHGEPPVINWGKDGKLVKGLLKLYSYERLVDLLEQFFTSPDKWVKSSDYSLSVFRASIRRLLVSEDRTARSRSDPVTIHTGWSKAGAILSKHVGREKAA